MAYQSEIEKLEQRFREKPEQWFAALADAYRKAGEVERALDVVRSGLEKRPNYTSGHIVLGRCLLDQGDDPEAAKAFERVLELDAENIIALKSLSEIAGRQGDRPGARRWLERLLDVDPMNDEARAELEALAQVEAEEASAAQSPPVDTEAETAELAELPVPTTDDARGLVDTGGGPEEEAVADVPELASDDVEVSALEAEAEAEAEPVAESLEVERASAVPDVDTLEMEPITVERVEADLEPVESSSEITAEAVSLEEPPHVEAAAAPSEPQPSDTVVPSEEMSATSGPPPAEEVVQPEVPPRTQETIPMREDVGEVPAELAADLDVTPFDEELSWDAGERLSREITDADLAEAEQLQEEALEDAAHYLPGLEYAEVPDISGASGEDGQDEHDAGVAEDVPAAEIVSDDVEPVGGLAAGDSTMAEALREQGYAPPPLEEADVPDVPLDEPVAVEAEAVAPEPEMPDDELVAEPPVFEESLEEEPAPMRASSAASDLPLILPEDVEAEEEEPEPEPVLTETMAEVYARQGLFDEAREIYQQLLMRRPGDPELERRLADLEARAVPVRPKPRGEFFAAASGEDSVRKLLQQVAAARPTLPASDAAAAGAAASHASPVEALDAVFEREEQAEGQAGAAGGEGLSLASVFGEEPSAARAAPPPAAGPQEVAPHGSSYEEFFGTPRTGSDVPAAAEAEDTESDDEGEEDFRDWLESLKS